jgi:hypothetical protein
VYDSLDYALTKEKSRERLVRLAAFQGLP